MIQHRERGWCDCLTCSGVIASEAPPPPESTERVRSRPRTRGDCIDGARPCPWSGCRYHLEHGGESCALDAADRGPLDAPQIAALMGMAKQRVYQIEAVALRRMSKRAIRLRAELDREVTRNITAPDDGADD